MAARLRALAKAILPDRFIHWYRRRRAIRNYLRELGFEIYDRQVRMQLEDLEGRIAARREGFYQQLVKDILDRTELIITQLDRRIEGQGTRYGKELRALREEVEALRSSVQAIGAQLNVSATP
jgi:hypothetical protein